ncbi:unnamed protein product [Discula destructiva]
MDKIRKKSYSDLEAIVTTPVPARQSYWDAKFAVASIPKSDSSAHGSEAPEAVPPGDAYRKDEAAQDAKALPNSTAPVYYLVDAKGQTQALYTAPCNTPSDTASTVNFKGDISPVAPSSSKCRWDSFRERKRVCGLRKNVCLAVIAGLCVWIVGLAITIVLVTQSRGGPVEKPLDSDPGRGQPFFTTQNLLSLGDAGPYLAASNIAAMNWTVRGQAYTGVFYQSSFNTGAALMVAIKNEETQSWTTVNISASATKTQLDVLPGTPLAAAAIEGLWNLFYLTSGMTVAEVYSLNPSSTTGWMQGDFAAKLGSPEVTPDSGLGAMWQSCDDCDNALFVTWQNAQSGALVFANMTNLSWGFPRLLDDSATPGTPVTVNAFTDTGRSIGADHNAIRFYHTEGDGLIETLKGPLGGGRLITGNNGEAITKGLSVAPAPRMASLTYGTGQGEAGWNNNLLAWTDPSTGQLKAANYIDAGEWSVDEPTLDESPQGLVQGGFSAVAMTQTLKIYLMSPLKGQIHEYSANSTNVFEWVWQTAVEI